MDGSKYDERVITLYGVVLKAMEEGVDFSEIQARAHDWFSKKEESYLRTEVELRDDIFYVVVYYNTDLDAVLAGREGFANEVAVPQSYLAKARERYYS